MTRPDRIQASAVGSRLANGDIALAVLGEPRPVLRDRSIEFEHPAVNQNM